MDHLSGLDATFLYLETPEQPMHVGGLNIFELPVNYKGDFLEDLRTHISARMHLAAVFRRKLVNMPFELANPIWVADEDVDLEYHIRSTVLPKPGSRAQLDKLVGRLHSSLLDRSRPLWEFYVIEGLQTPADALAGTLQIAFYSKVHHAAVDGAAGVAMANAIMDISAIPRAVRPASERRAIASDNFGIAELAVAGIKNTARQSAILAKNLPSLARAAYSMLRPPKSEEPALGLAGLELVDSPPKNRWFAPKTPINISITNQRIYSSLSFQLSFIKHIAKSNGVTLNDVVMAICAGALRHYLADLNCVPDQSLLAAVPVSLREAGNTEMNTQASMLRISLATTVADPKARLLAINQASKSAKSASASMNSVMPTDFPSLGVPWILSGMAALFGRSKLANNMAPLANLVISNVPGPNVALYMAGAKMLTYFPVSIVTHSLALNVTVQSYNGSLDFGLIACRKAIPDLPELAKYMQKTFAEMLAFTPKTDTVVTPAGTINKANTAHTKTAARPYAKPVTKKVAIKKIVTKKAVVQASPAKKESIKKIVSRTIVK
jgi:diacylglycerol O-acyltransferase / wax synthase